MQHSGVRLLMGVLGLLAVLLLLAGALLWYKLSTLKNELAADLGNSLGARVEVASLALDLWKGELHAAGITLANNRSDAPWESAQISQATIHFQLRDLLAPTLPLGLDVSSWTIQLHSPSAEGTNTSSSSATNPPAPSGEESSAHRFQVTRISAQQGDVQIDLSAGRAVLIHGVAFDAVRNGGGIWTTRLQAGSISAGSLALGASSVDLRGETSKIVFSELRMQCAQGIITGDGEVGLDGLHEMHLSLQALNVPVVMLVAVEWQMKLSGLATGNLSYQGNDQGASAQGQVSVNGGKFNVLPFLGKMTSLLGLPDITGLEVDKATTDFAWKDRALHLTNIDVRKTDVSRIAGQVDIDATGQVDGHLKLGLPTGVMAKWPQLQTAVFPVQVEDYSWADVHLTGTPDHLQEDFTPRLLAAGLQSGTGLLNAGTQKAMDLFKGLIGP